MAEFSLPANSKIVKGRQFRDVSSGKLRKVQVYRWNPDDGENPRVDTYQVDMDACGPMVLDVLIRIKNQIDSDLKSLIEELPDDQKEVLLMRIYKDMSFKEISENTGVSINTALGRMRYALINLRKIIEKNNIVLTS